ncbi:hypothetical protein ABZ923_10880 [Streptomyces sp. NPDC046881]|uniref:hypothetical protein n=1 Tax=Streptomyces sp. NPDC046881 TaxID=3155374 RepID=UPI00340F343F
MSETTVDQPPPVPDDTPGDPVVIMTPIEVTVTQLPPEEPPAPPETDEDAVVAEAQPGPAPAVPAPPPDGDPSDPDLSEEPSPA